MQPALEESDRARENRALLAATYERTYKYLYKEALSMVGSPETADEIVQEAFTVTAERIDEGIEIENIGGWLKTVVRNQCTHHWRRRPSVLLEEDLGLIGADSPAEIADTRQRCRDVYRAVNDLAPAQRSAFLLAELKGLDYREIAANLSRTEDAVRQLLARARKHIRETVGQDVASLTPILTQLEAEGLLRVDGHTFTLRDQLVAKLAHVHAQVASLLQRTAEVISQPAAALMAGATMIVALGGLSPAERPAGLADPNAPQAVISPISSRTVGSRTSSDTARSRQKGPGASARDRGPVLDGRKGHVSTPGLPGGGQGSVSPAGKGDGSKTQGTAGGHGEKSNSGKGSSRDSAGSCDPATSNCTGNSSTESDGEQRAGSERRQDRRQERRGERRQHRRDEHRQGGEEQGKSGGGGQGNSGGSEQGTPSGADKEGSGSGGQEGSGDGGSQGSEPPSNPSERGSERRRGRRR